MKQIATDVGYQLRGLPFWATVALSALVFYQGIFSQSSGDVIYLYTIAMNFGTFLVLASCIAALPCAAMLGRELRGGLYGYHVIRGGTARYLRNRAIASSVVGGLALLVGPLVVVLGLMSKFPLAGEYFEMIYPTDPGARASLATLLAARQYGLFLILKLLLVFLHGVSVTMICFAVSAFCANTFVVLFAPFILIQSYSLFLAPHLDILCDTGTWLTGYIMGTPLDDWGFMLYVLGVQVALWLLCWMIAYGGVRRREKYA